MTRFIDESGAEIDNNRPLKWGIVAVGKISHDFVNALYSLPNHKVVAAAARDLDRAIEFSKLHDIPQAYKGYEALAKDENVEVVYIGARNPQHFKVSKLMLEHGKHVLCEKPMCMNTAQVSELVNLAKKNGSFLMEGIWSRFFPGHKYMNGIIQSGVIGEIEEIDVIFCEYLKHLDRSCKKNLGGGATLHIGVYCIQLIQYIFKEYPKVIKASGSLNDDGCDETVIVELIFSNNRTARCIYSNGKTAGIKAILKGSKADIELVNFHRIISLTDTDGTVKDWPLPEVSKHRFNYTCSFGLQYEAEEVRKCIRNNLIESEHMTHKDSIQIARIEDEIRRQIGVVYDVDVN